MIEKIQYKNEELAIIIRNSFKDDGIHFFTPDTYAFQLGFMRYDKGKSIQPHTHLSNERKINSTSEVLFLRKGTVKINFYSNDKKLINSTILKSGDVILLIAGGHGFEMLEPSEIIEVKQGPFNGIKDKEKFDA